MNLSPAALAAAALVRDAIDEAHDIRSTMEHLAALLSAYVAQTVWHDHVVKAIARLLSAYATVYEGDNAEIMEAELALLAILFP